MRGQTVCAAQVCCCFLTQKWAQTLNAYPIFGQFSLTLVALLLFVLAILRLSHAANLTDEKRLNQRWVYTDDDSDYYDDEDYAKESSSNYLSMTVKPNAQIKTSYQPVLLVPDQPSQPVQPVIVAKVTPAVKKPPTYAPAPIQAYAAPPAKSVYDTPPGSFSPQSYGGQSNYGKKSTERDD